MPEMNGWEATQAIREKERNTGDRIPIIAMTAHAMKGDDERCFAAGMDDYLTKPIRTEELMAALEKVGAARSDAASARPQPAGTLGDETVELDAALDRLGRRSRTLQRARGGFSERVPGMSAERYVARSTIATPKCWSAAPYA